MDNILSRSYQMWFIRAMRDVFQDQALMKFSNNGNNNRNNNRNESNHQNRKLQGRVSH